MLVGPPGPPPPSTGADRTSVVLRLDNVPGALVSAMTEFAIRDIDLTRIESRPTRRELGTYIFFLDCVGHIDDDAVAEALKALHRRCADVRYLGSWPTGSPAGAVPPQLDEASGWLMQTAGRRAHERTAGAGPSRPVTRQRRRTARHPAAGRGAHRSRPRAGARVRARLARTTSGWWRIRSRCAPRRRPPRSAANSRLPPHELEGIHEAQVGDLEDRNDDAAIERVQRPSTSGGMRATSTRGCPAAKRRAKCWTAMCR